MDKVENLKPEQIWKHFAKILTIPRSSKHEDKMRDYIIEHAKERGLNAKSDTFGNVLVTIPGSPGWENNPELVIQSHIDMVCVKNSAVEFDFEKDPIPVKIEDDRLIGDGTTLGADNGIGVAIMLGLMDSIDVKHGPLELLFTVDEEEGMSGVSSLEPGFIKGKRLLNLDTEEWGEFYISCAGGGDVEITLPINRTDISSNQKLFRLSISGLKGGHSGVDINSGRGSAIKLLTRLLWKLNQKVEMDLVKIKGGSKRNVIASESFAVFVTDEATKEELFKIILPLIDVIKEELGTADPNLQISLEEEEEVNVGMRKLVHLSTEKLLDLLMALPHGVQAMSYDIPELVETSCNLGVLSTEDHYIRTTILVRSAITTKVEYIKDEIEALVKLAGGTVERPVGYPGWKPNPASPILAEVKDVYQKLYGEEPQVKAIHAGLECGIIGEKYPGIDMLSIGPDIKGAHTVGENVSISSVEKFWGLIKAILSTKPTL